jgi:hypothetical protein
VPDIRYDTPKLGRENAKIDGDDAKVDRDGPKIGSEENIFLGNTLFLSRRMPFGGFAPLAFLGLARLAGHRAASPATGGASTRKIAQERTIRRRLQHG